jgi:hypothetical protein
MTLVSGNSRVKGGDEPPHSKGLLFLRYSSNPTARNFASKVFGETPSFSAARVLFHFDSRKAPSSTTRSTCATARPLISSSDPSQLKLPGSIPAGKLSTSGRADGNCNSSA